MHKDHEEKLNYYKEQIIKSFIDKGIYPTDSLIAEYVNRVDLNLSLFKQFNVTTGKKFNVSEYNEMILLIYKDLKILYDIYYELAENKFYELQNYINSYINELSTLTASFENKSAFENNDTTLGQTLLFKDNSFIVNHDNATTSYDLGSITTKKGSKIACIANMDNIESKNVLFELSDGDNTLTISPYNLYKIPLQIEGEKEVNFYDINIDNEIRTPLVMNVTPEYENEYRIFNSESSVLIYDKEKERYYSEPVYNNSTSLLLLGKKRVSFYVVNAKSISFKFNKKPINANFPDEEIINIEDKVKYFEFETDSSFYFEIEVNEGKIYAVSDRGIINSKQLYYTGLVLANDFLVEEIVPGEDIEYAVRLNIYNDNDNDVNIRNVVIKELE